MIEQSGKYDLYEIKYAKKISQDMARALVQFQKEHPVRSAQVLSLQKKSYLLAKSVRVEHWAKN